jgi:hypothetical protein
MSTTVIGGIEGFVKSGLPATDLGLLALWG